MADKLLVVALVALCTTACVGESSAPQVTGCYLGRIALSDFEKAGTEGARSVRVHELAKRLAESCDAYLDGKTTRDVWLQKNAQIWQLARDTGLVKPLYNAVSAVEQNRLDARR